MGQAAYQSITIDHTLCGTADTLDFVVTWRGSSMCKSAANGGYAVTGNNGYDIRFYADSALSTTIPYDLIFVNLTTGAGIWKVKLNSSVNGGSGLTHGSDTVIYAACGDPTLTTDGSSTSTYASGWHLYYTFGDGTTLSLTDRTSNANTGTNNGTATASSGPNGDGAIHLVSGSSQYVSIPSSTSMNIGANAISQVCWVNTAQGDTRFMMGGYDTSTSAGWGWGLGIGGVATGKQAYFSLTNGSWQGSNTAVNDSAWHQLAVVSGVGFYLDGAADGTPTIATPTSATIQRCIAAHSDGTANFWSADIAHYGLYAGTLSSSHLTSLYNNQKASSTFYTNGAATSLAPPFVAVHWPEIGLAHQGVTLGH